jgi:hypothetical protein
MHQAVPLGATISEILKRQILANDFIELGKLLPESVEKTLKPKTLQVESLSNPVFTLKEQAQVVNTCIKLSRQKCKKKCSFKNFPKDLLWIFEMMK